MDRRDPQDSRGDLPDGSSGGLAQTSASLSAASKNEHVSSCMLQLPVLGVGGWVRVLEVVGRIDFNCVGNNRVDTLGRGKL